MGETRLQTNIHVNCLKEIFLRDAFNKNILLEVCQTPKPFGRKFFVLILLSYVTLTETLLVERLV